MKNKIIAIAQADLGQTEKSGNAGFLDPEFENEMKSFGFLPGESWCAIYVKRVWKKAYGNTIRWARIHTEEVFSKGAVRTHDLFKMAYPQNVVKIPEPGAIVIWQNQKNGIPQWTGHAGIVVEVLKDGNFRSIEGNSNDNGSREGVKVVLKDRFNNINSEIKNGLKVLGFIKPL